MKKKIFVLLLVVFVFSLWLSAAPKQPKIKVACVGNSITFGAGLSNQARDSYPSVLGQMLGKEYEVENFGVNGATLLSAGDLPYVTTRQYMRLFAYQPDIILIKLGTNDAKPVNWKKSDKFESDYQTLIDTLASIESEPKIYLCFPATSYVSGSIKDSVLVHGVIPRIRKVAEKNGLEIIDMHSVTANMKDKFPDTLHPDREASMYLAKKAFETITGKKIDFRLQEYPGIKTRWRGYDKYDFKFKGRDAIIVAPEEALPGKPWIWRPAFFGAFPSVDVAMLSLGYHVVYYDVTFLYGSPRSQIMGDEFYEAMLKYYGFSEKVILEGFSRGGLFAVNWAAKNPDKVSCIYLDAPVCDIESWPGRRQEGLWKEFLAEWDLTEDDMRDFHENPTDHLKPLAKHHIPIIGVAGDKDTTVPFNENLEILAQKYRKMGGKIEVIVKPGCDHHPHSLEAPAEIVRFILNNAR